MQNISGIVKKENQHQFIGVMCLLISAGFWAAFGTFTSRFFLILFQFFSSIVLLKSLEIEEAAEAG